MTDTELELLRLWTADDLDPTRVTDEVGERRTVYSYDGPPEYTCGDHDSDAVTVVADELCGRLPDYLRLDGDWYIRVASYSMSGAGDCPMQEPLDCECPYCGAEPGSEHGEAYIGDGWAEIVYEPCEPGYEPVREHAGYNDGIEYYRTDTGWYWRASFPGCLPDGEPWGPFKDLADSMADSMEGREPETAGVLSFT